MVSLRWGSTSNQHHEDVIFFLCGIVVSINVVVVGGRAANDHLLRHWNAVHRSINIKRQQASDRSFLSLFFYLFIQYNKKTTTTTKRKGSISDLLFCCFLLHQTLMATPAKMMKHIFFFPSFHRQQQQLSAR